MTEHRIGTTELRAALPALRAGDRVLLSGTVYTARDAAHKRMFELLACAHPLPFPVRDACVYYAGPTPPPPGRIVGSFGPTTSKRMDAFTPRLVAMGLVCMIGKGNRSPDVVRAMTEYGCVYLCAVGGAGALISRSIRSCREIAFHDLGCESVKELEVVDFPSVVGIDCTGNSLFGTYLPAGASK